MVASCGLYFPMVAKSPESQTTVVPMAFNCSRELAMILYCYLSVVTREVGRLEWVSSVERKVVESKNCPTRSARSVPRGG